MAPNSRSRAKANSSNHQQAQSNNLVFNEDSMDVDVEPQIKLKSNDGKKFTLSKSEAFCSNALKSMIESHQPVGATSSNQISTPSEYITLNSVNSEWLSRVVEWCQRHCNDAEFDEDRDVQFDSSTGNSRKEKPFIRLTNWDKQFFQSMSEEDLLRLIHVSNYLDVRGLLNASCQTIAKRWEGKKVEEIRKMYGIENDFDADEEHKLLLESKKLGLDN